MLSYRIVWLQRSHKNRFKKSKRRKEKTILRKIHSERGRKWDSLWADIERFDRVVFKRVVKYLAKAQERTNTLVAGQFCRTPLRTDNYKHPTHILTVTRLSPYHCHMMLIQCVSKKSGHWSRRRNGIATILRRYCGVITTSLPRAYLSFSTSNVFVQSLYSRLKTTVWSSEFAQTISHPRSRFLSDPVI